MLHGSQKINEGVCERKLEVTIWWFWENRLFLLSLHLSFVFVRKFTNWLRTKIKHSCLANKKVFALKKQKCEEETNLERLWSKLYKNGFDIKKTLCTLQLHCKLLKSFISFSDRICRMYAKCWRILILRSWTWWTWSCRYLLSFAFSHIFISVSF